MTESKWEFSFKEGSEEAKDAEKIMNILNNQLKDIFTTILEFHEKMEELAQKHKRNPKFLQFIYISLIIFFQDLQQRSIDAEKLLANRLIELGLAKKTDEPIMYG